MLELHALPVRPDKPHTQTHPVSAQDPAASAPDARVGTSALDHAVAPRKPPAEPNSPPAATQQLQTVPCGPLPPEATIEQASFCSFALQYQCNHLSAL